MNTVPPSIALHRGPGAAWLDRLHDVAQRLRAAWADYRTHRAAEDAERQLAELDPRTLRDIGAPEGLVGQRRWQDEQRDHDRLLDRRGW